MQLNRIIHNLLHYGKSPRSALLALQTLLEYRIVKKSSLVDHRWVTSQYSIHGAPECDPIIQYIVAAHTSDYTSPAPCLVDAEYRAIHHLSKFVLPVVHYELFGKKKGLVLSSLELAKNKGRKAGYFSHTNYTIEDHLASFSDTIEVIRAKVKNGEKVRVAFLVFSASMFPTKPLFDKLTTDGQFDPKIIIIPDLRWPNIDPHAAMNRCYAELRMSCPDDKLIRVDADQNGEWPDVVSGFDIVSYATPYDMSDYHYNPRWAIGRRMLPIQANYTLSSQNYGLVLFSLSNQAVFWKTFFECGDLLDEFKNCMLTKGRNCPITGYMKMDHLAGKPSNESTRKCVIIAPHHSVSGGYNEMLSVSNFLRYSDFFKDLPCRYPQVDFVFRPHPFLIQALRQETVWGAQKTDAYFSELTASPNMTLSLEGDYLTLFARSDGIIQDCCSFLIEYFYTGKPQCYMLKTEAETEKKFLKLGKRCLAACYQAYAEKDIDRFLKDVILGGNDLKRKLRDDLRKRLMVNYPHATEAALGLIKRELGMDV